MYKPGYLSLFSFTAETALRATGALLMPECYLLLWKVKHKAAIKKARCSLQIVKEEILSFSISHKSAAVPSKIGTDSCAQVPGHKNQEQRKLKQDISE